ncbi:hypothetical protein MMC30_006381 [Trapelia coarctata]|nr:hypothetical protein [Trapelia coarctata]
MAKIVLSSVATGAMVTLNDVGTPRGLLRGSHGTNSESKTNNSNITEPLLPETLPIATGGPSAQDRQMERMEEELAQAKKTIKEQRLDLDRCLRSIEGLKAGLFSAQEYIGRIETEGATSHTNHGELKAVEGLTAELQRLKRRIDVLETENPHASLPQASKARPAQTARMRGPLARRPHPSSHTASSSEYTPTVGRPVSSATKVNSPAVIASVESKDIIMGDNPQNAALGPLGSTEKREGDDHAVQLSPGTLIGSNRTIAESDVLGETNNVGDALMGPPAPPSKRQSNIAASQSVRPSIRNTPRYSNDTIELDTQEYLRRTVPAYDTEDIDYEPSQRSLSPASLRPSDLPASIEIQSSLDNLLDPATPMRRRKVSDSRRGQSTGRRSTALSRKSYVENRRLTPEWELDDWEDPRESFGAPSYTTPSRSRGSNSVRRGVSGGLGGSARAPKRQKSESYGLERERDAEGYLLRADGKRDMRSARYRKPQGEDGGSDGTNGINETDGANELNGPNGTDETNAGNTTQSGYGEKHEWIMHQIFSGRRKSKAGTLG